MKLKINNEIVYYQKDNKFKNIILGIFLVAPINMKYYMEWPIIGSLLEKTNAKYKTVAELQNYSYDNYGLSVTVDTYYSGSSYLFRFFASYVNPKYLPEKIDLTISAFELLKTTILSPDFTQEKLELEKYHIRNAILNRKSNKQKYAFQEYMKVLCQGSITEKITNKSLEALNKVSIETINEAYKEMLKFSRLSFIAGDITKKEVVEHFSKLDFPKSAYDYHNLVMYEQLPRVSEVKEKIINDLTKSSILYVGYKTDIYYFNDDFFSLDVLSLLLGGESYSETYKRIREEHGLVYYVDCNYDKRRGTITFVMEIDRQNYDKVMTILKEIISDYQNGKFESKVLELAKREITNVLMRENDRESSVCNMLYDEIDHIKSISIEEAIQKYASIQKEDIQRVVQKLELDTIFFLRGEE